MNEDKLDVAQKALWLVATMRLGHIPHLHFEELKAIQGVAKEALIKINPLADDFFASNKGSF